MVMAASYASLSKSEIYCRLWVFVPSVYAVNGRLLRGYCGNTFTCRVLRGKESRTQKRHLQCWKLFRLEMEFVEVRPFSSFQKLYVFYSFCFKSLSRGRIFLCIEKSFGYRFVQRCLRGDFNFPFILIGK